MAAKKSYRNTSSRRPTPWYGKAWAVGLFIFIGFMLAGTISVFVKAATAPREPELIVNYTWTDENGVIHFSDKKEHDSAREVISERTPESALQKILRNIRYYGIAAFGKLVGTVAAIAVISALVGASCYSGLKYYAETRKRSKRVKNVKAAVQNFKYFRSSLSPDIDKSDYHNKINGISASLEKLKESYPSIEESHGPVISFLDRSLESYSDCTTLWNISSQEDIVWADRNGYLMKYPSLVSLMENAGRSRSGSISRTIRATIWKYASSYVDRAEEALANPPITNNY